MLLAGAIGGLLAGHYYEYQNWRAFRTFVEEAPKYRSADRGLGLGARLAKHVSLSLHVPKERISTLGINKGDITCRTGSGDFKFHLPSVPGRTKELDAYRTVLSGYVSQAHPSLPPLESARTEAPPDQTVPEAPEERELDLSHPVSYNGCAINGTSPVRVVTTSDQWSYAAGFSVRSSDVPGAAGIRIHIKARVEKGRVGFIFVASDNISAVLGHEEELSETDVPAVIELVAEQVPKAGWVIVRNTAAGGIFSGCAIHSITVAAAPAPRPSAST